MSIIYIIYAFTKQFVRQSKTFSLSLSHTQRESGNCFNKKLTIGCWINCIRQFRNIHNKLFLYIVQYFSVFLRGNKRNCKTLSAEPTSTSNLATWETALCTPAYSVQVRVWIFRHIIIDDNIHSLDINTTAEKIGRHHYSTMEFLKFSVAINAIAI